MRRSLVIAAAGLPLVFAAALYYFLTLAFAEDLTVSEGSVAAYILVRSEVVRDFPRIQPVGAPHYRYESRGSAAPATSLIYTTTAAPPALQADGAAFLSARGYAGDPAQGYVRDGEAVTVSVAEVRTGLWQVTVTSQM